MNNASLLIARIFLGQIFLLAGISKIGAYEGTQGYMQAMGVPQEEIFTRLGATPQQIRRWRDQQRQEPEPPPADEPEGDLTDE